MMFVNQQILTGAAIAAVLTIGATASTNAADGQGVYAAFSLNRTPAAYAAQMLRVCGDEALNVALDAIGAVAGNLQRF